MMHGPINIRFTFLIKLVVVDSKTSPTSMELESYLPFFTTLISILILSSCLGLGIFRDFLLNIYAPFPRRHWCYTFLYNDVRTVKCTLLQALRVCTGRTAHRGSRGITLLFLDDTRRGEGSASRLGRFCPRETPGTHCTGSWVGRRVDLDKCGKSGPHRDSVPGPSSP